MERLGDNKYKQKVILIAALLITLMNIVFIIIELGNNVESLESSNEEIQVTGRILDGEVRVGAELNKSSLNDTTDEAVKLEEVKAEEVNAIVEVEKAFTVENILESIKNNEYLNNRFNIARDEIRTITLNKENQKYDITRKYKFYGKGVSKDKKEDGTLIDITMTTINSIPTDIKIKHIESNSGEMVENSKDAIKLIMTNIVGEKIAHEIFEQENDILTEYSMTSEDLKVSTIKNIQSIEETNNIQMEYSVILEGKPGDSVKLAEFKFNREKDNTFDWLVNVNNSKSAIELAENISKIYGENNKYIITKIESDDSDFYINTSLDIQIDVEDTIEKVAIKFIGMDIADKNGEDTKVQKTIYCNMSLPSMKNESIAIENAVSKLKHIFGIDVKLDKELDGSIEFSGSDNNGSTLRGTIQKVKSTDESCVVNIRSTFEDKTLIKSYNEEIVKLKNK